MSTKDQLTALIEQYKQLGIDTQIDYEKFYLYSIITHSTAIEGSTVTEIENQLLFDEGITAKGKPLMEQMMNLDLKRAYEESIRLAKNRADISIDILKALSHLVMQNTGSTYKTALGDFSSANGDLRTVNVTAGAGGRSYMSYQKVPAKLQEFCDWLNVQRKRPMSLSERYDLSFEAHYRLVTIHPWVDGNGRMARLVMNHIQFEFGLIPAKVLKEDKGDYINALIATRDADDMSVFLEFMTGEMIKTLSSDIEVFLKSMDEGGEISRPIGEKKQKSREKILRLLKDHPNYSARKLAEVIGITPKAIEKHLAKLKAEGLIKREGPDKGGSWIVYTLLSFCLLLFSSCGARDTYYQTPNNGFTRIPYLRWINQQVFLKTSSDSKLETMALHSNNPANRAMAFDGLVTRRSPRCYDVLLAELTDTSSFNVQWLDLIFDTNVASYDLEAAEEDSLLFVEEQRHHIDSVVLFGTGLDHLDRQPSAFRLHGMNGVYERVRNLCLDGDSNLLPALAEYKNPQDIPLVAESLLGDNQSDIDPETAIERSQNALAAIMLWRDEAFVPALEEYREEKLTNGVRDYYGVKMLLQTVMAYDNEWACHYIEDLFMRCEKDRDIYSELFFETFYENNERPRFLPFVEKYGKRPFGWGGEY